MGLQLGQGSADSDPAPDAQSGAAGRQTAAPGMPRCPNCGWVNVRFSHSKGMMDSLFNLLSVWAFRCRSCGTRFRKFYRKQAVES